MPTGRPDAEAKNSATTLGRHKSGEKPLKIGMNLLVVAGFITEQHRPLFERLKTLGYDGVEIPIFEGSPEHYRALGRLLDAVGLERTAVAIIPDVERNPLSASPAVRQAAAGHLAWAIDCAEALGAGLLAGPYHSPLGVFTGSGPTEDELANAALVHRAAADHAARAGIRLALEPLNRFECYAVNTLAQAAAHKARVGHANFTYMQDFFHSNIEERDLVRAVTEHADAVAHYHIAENDRGIPGRGHLPWGDLIGAIRRSGYDGWLTVEAFGRSLQALAAATRIWRDLFPDLDTLFAESIRLIRTEWERAAP